MHPGKRPRRTPSPQTKSPTHRRRALFSFSGWSYRWRLVHEPRRRDFGRRLRTTSDDDFGDSDESGQGILAQPSAGGATRLGPGSGNRCIFLSTASADIGAVKQHLSDEQHLFYLPWPGGCSPSTSPLYNSRIPASTVSLKFFMPPGAMEPGPKINYRYFM